MASFPLRIVTPDGLVYNGQASSLSVRTAAGDVGILAGHTDFVAPLGMGTAIVVTDEGTKKAACIGGMVSCISGEVTLVPTTFEWADKIDLARAQNAKAIAEQTILDSEKGNESFTRAEAKLKRALVRISVAGSGR